MAGPASVDMLICNLLLNAEGSFDGVNSTILHIPVRTRRGQPDIMRILMNAKADVNARDTSGRLPLIVAARHRKTNKIETLLSADPDSFDVHNRNGRTALMLTIMNYIAPDDARIVRILLEHTMAHCAAESHDDGPPKKRFTRTE